MPRYLVPLTGSANLPVVVETDATVPGEVARLAERRARPALCHHCFGEDNDSLKIGEEGVATEGDTSRPEIHRMPD